MAKCSGRGCRLCRSNARSSQPAELAVELVAAQDQGCRAAVRTVVGVVNQMPLREQAFSMLQPPQHREVWNVLVESFAQATAFPLDILRFDRYAYANMLIGMPYASDAGRYSRLIDDAIANGKRN